MAHEKRPPYPGDILKNPQRCVSWVNRDTREFRCSHFSDTGPGVVNGIDWGDGWGEAPIEEGWTELETDDKLEGKR